jgi:hypothetical protein
MVSSDSYQESRAPFSVGFLPPLVNGAQKSKEIERRNNELGATERLNRVLRRRVIFFDGLAQDLLRTGFHRRSTL